MKNAGSENASFNVAVAGLGWWGKAIIGMLKDSPKVRVVKSCGHGFPPPGNGRGRKASSSPPITPPSWPMLTLTG